MDNQLEESRKVHNISQTERQQCIENYIDDNIQFKDHQVQHQLRLVKTVRSNMPTPSQISVTCRQLPLSYTSIKSDDCSVIIKSSIRYYETIKQIEQERAASQGVTPAKNLHNNFERIRRNYQYARTPSKLNYHNAHTLIKSITQFKQKAFHRIETPTKNTKLIISAQSRKLIGFHTKNALSDSIKTKVESTKKTESITSRISRNPILYNNSDWTVEKLMADTNETIHSIYNKFNAHEQIFTTRKLQKEENWRKFLHEPEYALQLMSKQKGIDISLLIEYLTDYVRALNFIYPAHPVNIPTKIFLSQLLSVAAVNAMSSYQLINIYKALDSKQLEYKARLAQSLGIDKDYFYNDSSTISFDKYLLIRLYLIEKAISIEDKGLFVVSVIE